MLLVTESLGYNGLNGESALERSKKCFGIHLFHRYNRNSISTSRISFAQNHFLFVVLYLKARLGNYSFTKPKYAQLLSINIVICLPLHVSAELHHIQGVHTLNI